MEKFLNDAANGILWEDDANIVWMLRSKTYTEEKEGKTILYACEIENDIPKYEEIIAEIEGNIKIG